MNKYILKHPDSLLKKCFPKSLVIETHDAYDPEMMLMGVSPSVALNSCLEEASLLLDISPVDSLWVLKPSLANKGADIMFIRGGEDGRRKLKHIIQSLSDAREFVMQEYVYRPLLLRNRKFHIRSYVLAVGALDVYLYTESLLLSAFAKFNTMDEDDLSVHLTNTYQASQYKGFKEHR